MTPHQCFIKLSLWWGSHSVSAFNENTLEFFVLYAHVFIIGTYLSEGFWSSCFLLPTANLLTFSESGVPGLLSRVSTSFSSLPALGHLSLFLLSLLARHEAFLWPFLLIFSLNFSDGPFLLISFGDFSIEPSFCLHFCFVTFAYCSVYPYLSLYTCMYF